MDVKVKYSLQLFNKSKLRNGTKMFLDSKFFSIVKFKKLGFSAPFKLSKEVAITIVKSLIVAIKIRITSCY